MAGRSRSRPCWNHSTTHSRSTKVTILDRLLIVTITSTNPAVPKEVGKVGTESPAFIQPITERKDGIRAMFAKQQKRSPSPAKPPAPTSEQAQPETQPQSESQSSGKSQVSSEFPTTPVGKRKASAVEDSGVKTPQGSPTKKPRLGSASPRKGGPSPTVSIHASHATLRLVTNGCQKQKGGQTSSITDFFTRKALS